jgi:ubiquinone/menaquinone biosynthesis C-methylase UbiE
MSKRLKYQMMFAKGKVVNLGCGEVPIDLGEDCVHVDLDEYNHKNFVKSDIHDMPFEDKEFDTAILGDVLEHSPDPVKMLKEAGRVAKKVVATVFEEWRDGDKTTEERIQLAVDETKKLGFDSHEDYLKSLEWYKDKIVKVTDDSEVPHHYHIQNFTNESLREVIKEAGLKIIIMQKFKEGEHEGRDFFNWLLVLE